MSLVEKERKKKLKFLEELGLHIRKLRMERNITSSELAKRIFMEKQNFYRIEKGKTSTTLYTIKRICSSLDMTLDEFFEEFKYK